MGVQGYAEIVPATWSEGSTVADYFKNGKRDAEHGIYRPPHNVSTYERIVHGDENSKEQREDRSDYKAGQKAGKRD